MTGHRLHVLPLDNSAATLPVVGGKGASLARLAQAGFAVLPGFHVTTAAYRRFIEENHLQAGIVAAAGLASADDPASLNRAASAIRAQIGQGRMPDDIAAETGVVTERIRGGQQITVDGDAGVVMIRQRQVSGSVSTRHACVRAPRCLYNLYNHRDGLPD